MSNLVFSFCFVLNWSRSKEILKKSRTQGGGARKRQLFAPSLRLLAPIRESPLSPDRAVWGRDLARDIALCSWAKHLTFTMALSTQG